MLKCRLRKHETYVCEPDTHFFKRKMCICDLDTDYCKLMTYISGHDTDFLSPKHAFVSMKQTLESLTGVFVLDKILI